MRLLIITQKIDERDAVLGFMHGWLAEFSNQAKSVVAVCLEKGAVSLPANVKVFSLGKERGVSKLGYIFNFYKIIWQTRRECDAVFVHMNAEYVVLGGLLWKILGKKVTLWYAHKSVTASVRIANFLSDIIFTSTASGFRLSSKKVKVIGQGIDTEKFKYQISNSRNEVGAFKIVTVGRITPSKDYDTLIDAIDVLKKNSNLEIIADIIGPTSGKSDEEYLSKLKQKIAQKGLTGIINFLPPVANSALTAVLSSYQLFVNMGHTGSLDKAVPEAMAVGLPVLTCNEAFYEVLGPFRANLMYPKGDFKALSDKINWVVGLSEIERKKLGEELRAIVVRDHSLQSFVGKIISILESH